MPDLRICIDVDDLERGIAFYTKGLGMKLARRRGADWAELDAAGSTIDLLVKPPGSPAFGNGPPARDYGRHWTPVHLDLVVPDLDHALQGARAAGATLERIQVREWGRMANMADPFGHGFCLLEFRGRGYDEVAGEEQ